MKTKTKHKLRNLSSSRLTYGAALLGAGLVLSPGEELFATTTSNRQTFTYQSEALEGPGGRMPRSMAVGSRTVYITQSDQRLNGTLTLPRAAILEEIRVIYSNDGPADRIYIRIAGRVFEFVTRDTRPVGGVAGSGWNNFLEAVATVTGGLSLSAGTTPFSLDASVDVFGTEVDQCSFLVRYEGDTPGPVQDDHGDSIDRATPLFSGQAVNGRIDRSGDVDYFKFDVAQSSIVSASSFGSTDTYGKLLDSQGRVLATDDDGGVDLNFSFQREVAPGTYSVAVSHYSSTGTGPYSVRVDLQPLTAPDDGNTISQARTIIPGQVVNARIDYAGDIDVFAIPVSQPSMVTARSMGDIDTYGRLLDAQNIVLRADDDSGADRNFSLSQQIGPGVFYLQVEHYSPTATGPYSFVVDVQPLTSDTDGNSTSTATPISPGQTRTARIDIAGDVDVFAVTVLQPATLVASSAGTIDTFARLLDAQGRALASDDDGGPSLNFIVQQTVAPGVYFLEVSHYQSTGTGSYSVRVDLLGAQSGQPR